MSVRIIIIIIFIIIIFFFFFNIIKSGFVAAVGEIVVIVLHVDYKKDDYVG